MKKYVYACISKNSMSSMDKISKTRKYQKALELSQLLQADGLIVDICSSWERRKRNLEHLLSNRGNIIIVTDISSLGKQDEVAAVYNRILATGNDIMVAFYGKNGVLDIDDVSTVSLDFEKREGTSISENVANISRRTTTEFRQMSCYKQNPQIIEAYWKMEKEELDNSSAPQMLGISLSTLYRRTKEYVGTDEWFKRYFTELRNSDIISHRSRTVNMTNDAMAMYNFMQNPVADKNLSVCEIAYRVGITDRILPVIEDMPNDASLQDVKQIVHIYNAYRLAVQYAKYLKTASYKPASTKSRYSL